MTFQVMTATITGRTASGTGFDLTLDAEHTRAIGFSKVPCDEIAPGVRRVPLPVDFFLNEECLEGLVGYIQNECPNLEGWITELREKVLFITGSDAFVSLRPNPSVAGECGDELCYYDRRLNIVVCFE